MTALFTNIVTGFLILLGLFSLGENLPFAALYTFFAFLGLGASYWQLKTRPVPRLRTIINIIFFLLTLNAILPFFTLKIKHDMFTMLINTWVYLLVLSTFIICGRRDYYITQGLALGLIIYACFYATNNPLALLGYSTGFLALWITALRSINLLPDEKSGEKITGGTMDVYREIKLGAMLFFAVLIIALPFYFLVPRFDIPLLPLDRILRQRYSAIYSDFPKRGLVAFLSKNPKDIMTDATKQGGKTPGPGGSQPQLQVTPEVTKPVFYHGSDLQKLNEKIKEIDDRIRGLAKENNLPGIEKNLQQRQGLLEKEEELNENKRNMESDLSRRKEEYLKMAALRSNPPEGQDSEVAAAAAKALEAKMKQAENQMQQVIDKIKDVEKQLEKMPDKFNEVKAEVYKQAEGDKQEIRILWDKKEELENQAKTLKAEGQTANITQPPKPEENKKAEETAATKATKKEHRAISILDIILYILILIILAYVLIVIFSFIFPYIRYKNRIAQASLEGRYNLSISLLYNFLGRVLAIFGNRYPITVVPEEYLKTVNERFGDLYSEYQNLTAIFIEARYSDHKLSRKHEEDALDCYRSILQELRMSGAFWPKQILRIGFLFNL